MHLIAARRQLANDDARWYCRTRGLCGNRDAKPAGAQHIGGALTVEADQIGHQIGGAIFAAIHQQPHFGGWRRRRRILCDDDVGAVVRRSNLGDTRR